MRQAQFDKRLKNQINANNVLSEKLRGTRQRAEQVVGLCQMKIKQLAERVAWYEQRVQMRPEDQPSDEESGEMGSTEVLEKEES